MSTLVKEESIADTVRRLKEENAKEHGFDIHAIAAAARAEESKHPERVVTRAVETVGETPETRSVAN